ncbi:hypothetical protein MCAG_00259 [Micromonospora sp. ATCC 39149]|uniref:enolase C-terminal domain-like protein n=1 Tax=Micromonospora sp. (strain ATCC 39149 / NRRL 15099 / SCC 1413) TaxID=219305 RepID=UPI0001A50CCC|nr:enolase C-terminal domain-like protein [Micromonospora sp. ATCC 39149]EEP69932.1 hypothetical protein MCAG_00259 [Micromonospora sp. ATCC 39149]
MNLDWRVYPLPLAEPLRISRSTMARRDAVAVRLTHDGVTGHGEVVTSVYQRLDLSRIGALLTALRPRVTGYADPEALRADLPALAADLSDAPGVLGALDAAVHDLVGRRAGISVQRLVDAPARATAATAYTIGLGPPAAAAATARRLVAAGFTVLKIKAGAGNDVARVAAVRAAAPAARLLLDPNGAWTAERAVRLLDAVAACDVDAVEQPVPPGDPDALAWIGGAG